MNLEQEFNKETGRKSYNTVNCCYDGYYVEWLEERIKQLTIHSVVVPKGTLCDKQVDLNINPVLYYCKDCGKHHN